MLEHLPRGLRMDSVRIDFDQYEWEYGSAGMRVKRVVRGGKQMRLVEIGPDFGEADWCEEGHTGVVLEGELEIHFDKTIERLSAGDGVFILGGREARHKSKAVGWSRSVASGGGRLASTVEMNLKIPRTTAKIGGASRRGIASFPGSVEEGESVRGELAGC